MPTLTLAMNDWVREISGGKFDPDAVSAPAAASLGVAELASAGLAAAGAVLVAGPVMEFQQAAR
jgi:hypothetical protein